MKKKKGCARKKKKVERQEYSITIKRKSFLMRTLGKVLWGIGNKVYIFGRLIKGIGYDIGLYGMLMSSSKLIYSQKNEKDD